MLYLESTKLRKGKYWNCQGLGFLKMYLFDDSIFFLKTKCIDSLKKSCGKTPVMIMKFQSSFLVPGETFFCKRQPDTVWLAPCLGPCTHVGRRRVLLAFLFSGEYPGHQATATLLIPDLLHWGFDHFVPIAREIRTWPFSSYAHLSYLAMIRYSSPNQY